MRFTRILNAAKSKFVVVEIESTVTGYKCQRPRERKEDKLEIIHFDPLIRKSVVFKETKKVGTVDNIATYEPWTNEEIDKTRIESWQIRSHLNKKITSSEFE